MSYQRKVIFPLIVIVCSAILYVLQMILSGHASSFFWIAAFFYALLAWGFGCHYDQLKKEAEQDVLTKVYNRRTVPDIFQRLTKLSEKQSQKVIAFFIDVDNFKMINDTYGHNMGDVLLQRISSVLQDTFREKGWVARWGGDEFLVLLLWDDASGIETMHNQLLQKLCHHYEDMPEKITLSVGYAIYPDEGKHLQQILSVADEKMFQQKNQ